MPLAQSMVSGAVLTHCNRVTSVMVTTNTSTNLICLGICIIVALTCGVALADVQLVRSGDCVVRVVSEDTLQFEGKRYPRGFLLEFPSMAVRDADAVSFVLVEPGTTVLDGLPLRIDKPFYIAADVLSISQALALLDNASLDEYVAEQMEKWADMAHERGMLEEFSEYLSNSKYPYFVQDFEDVFQLSRAAALRIGVFVRSPTLAEWTLAMRAGRQTRFWWGDDWPPPDAAVPMPDEDRREQETWGKLEQVTSGTPNPLGLYHMIGNVESLVFPTEPERQALLRHFRPGGEGWQGKKASSEALGVKFSPDYWRKVYQVSPYAFLTPGASVFDRPKLAEETAISLSMIVPNQFPGPLPAHPLIALPVGMRLVIPLESADQIGLAKSEAGTEAPSGIRSAPDTNSEPAPGYVPGT